MHSVYFGLMLGLQGCFYGAALTGWALVLVLFVSITFNDILKLLGKG